MSENLMKIPQHQFRIVFNGEVEKVDVNILIATLLHTTTILNEINNDIDPKQKLNIQIEPFAPGSFHIVYSLAQHGLIGDLINIVSPANIQYLAGIVTILAGIYQIKKILKGKRPKNIEKVSNGVKITSGNGNSIVVDNRVYNIYGKNPVVNDAINKTFRTLEEFEQIDAFSVTEKDGTKLVSIPRSEFCDMGEKNELIEEDLEIKVIPDVKLFLHKIVFKRDNKWGFIYEGNKIGAFIKDSGFFDKIDDHSFNLGDYFVADLRITRKYDPDVKAYLNQEYEVLKIKEHIKMPSQHKMPFPAE